MSCGCGFERNVGRPRAECGVDGKWQHLETSFQQTWCSQVKSTWLGRKTVVIRTAVVKKNVRRQMWTDGQMAF